MHRLLGLAKASPLSVAPQNCASPAGHCRKSALTGEKFGHGGAAETRLPAVVDDHHATDAEPPSERVQTARGERPVAVDVEEGDASFRLERRTRVVADVAQRDAIAVDVDTKHAQRGGHAVDRLLAKRIVAD